MHIESERSTPVIANPVVSDRLKLLGMLEEILKVKANSLAYDQRLKDLEQWDSLAALDFVLKTEKLFSVTLEIDDIVKCELVGQLVDLATKGLQPSSVTS
jgi:acyl carrier protein